MNKFCAMVLTMLIGSTLGCNSGVKTHPVRGTVTAQGQPLESGTICFEDTARGVGNSAELKAGGKYEVDLPEGSYGVFLYPAMEDRIAEDGTHEEAFVDEKKFPNKFRTAKTSGLSLNVPASTTLDVDLP